MGLMFARRRMDHVRAAKARHAQAHEERQAEMKAVEPPEVVPEIVEEAPEAQAPEVEEKPDGVHISGAKQNRSAARVRR